MNNTAASMSLVRNVATSLLLFGLSANAVAESVEEHTARIQTVVQSITLCVDLRRFDLLERFYAEQVVADYSSLWGNEPRRLERTEIGSAWAGFIPGFDTTRHDVTNIDVTIDGSRATASADVIASHWLDDEIWVIGGRYVFELERAPEDWVVSGWTFLLESESGDRALVDVAEARAGLLAP